MSAARRSEPDIYKVETIPPPDGEDDAYSAPTKVGPMARAAVAKMFAELGHDAPHETTQSSAPPTSGVRSIPPELAVPVIYDAEDESQFDPTAVVSPMHMAKKSSDRGVSIPIPAPPRLPSATPSMFLPVVALMAPVKIEVAEEPSFDVGGDQLTTKECILVALACVVSIVSVFVSAVAIYILL